MDDKGESCVLLALLEEWLHSHCRKSILSTMLNFKKTGRTLSESLLDGRTSLKIPF